MSRDKYGWSIHVSKVCSRVRRRYAIQVGNQCTVLLLIKNDFWPAWIFFWTEPKLLGQEKNKIMHWNVIFGQLQKNWTCPKSFWTPFWARCFDIYIPNWFSNLEWDLHHKYRYHSIVHIRWPQMWRVAAARRTLRRRPAIIASIHTCVDVVWLH